MAYDQNRLEEVWTREYGLRAYPRTLDAYTGQGLRIHGMPILHHYILDIQTVRMAAQQGVFTVCTDVYADHAVLLRQLLGPKAAGEAFRKIVIPASLKVQFLSQLRLMNITGVSLFPGVDGVGRRTTEAAYMSLLNWNKG